jgi:hypothetical protein
MLTGKAIFLTLFDVGITQKLPVIPHVWASGWLLVNSAWGFAFLWEKRIFFHPPH